MHGPLHSRSNAPGPAPPAKIFLPQIGNLKSTLVYAGLRWSTLVYPGRSSLRRGCGPPGPPAGARPPLVPWPRLLPRAASLGASRARHGGREFVNYLTRIRPLRNGVECYSKSPSATVTPAHSAAAHAMGTPVASEAWAYPGLPRSSMVYPSLRWSTLVYAGLRWSTLVYPGR